MNAVAYRRMRIVVGGFVLGACALVFADIGNWVSAFIARMALWPQFAPSVLGFIDGVVWMSAGCVAVIVLTLLFGRVYCAMLCPLGVLMDLSARMAGRSGRDRKLPYRRGRTWLRVLVVTVCAAGLVAGTALPLAFLDPYSVFGKITAATLRPALGWINHLIASTKLINPVDVSPVAWVSAGIAAGLLGLVVVSAVFRGRLWCNTVCPVGAVLGLLSKHALFRLQIADSACVACSMCERVCPSQCIDFRNHAIDHSRCVMCLDCVTSCKRSGIRFARARRRTERGSPPLVDSPLLTPMVSRRSVLTFAALVPAVAFVEDKPHGPKPRPRRAVLPPGAKSLAHFQSRCTACHLCVANCPDQVLVPSITRHGLAGFLQPYQDFSVAFCSYNCSNCSQICPTGAIGALTVEERRTVRTGAVEFFQDLCIVKTKGTSCGACSEHCPTQAVHMVPWENNLTIPEIRPELCVGCGGCEFICPVRPQRAIVVNGLQVHERAEKIILGQKNTVRKMEEEFPF